MSETYSVDDILRLIEAVNSNKISKLEIKDDGFELEIKGLSPASVVISPSSSHLLPEVDSSAPLPSETSPAIPSGNVIKSPIVGTFYASSSPDKAPYIAIGDKVELGDVLFIIESMKLMNEVTSDFSGTVKEILVENESPIEYGQPILILA